MTNKDVLLVTEDLVYPNGLKIMPNALYWKREALPVIIRHEGLVGIAKNIRREDNKILADIDCNIDIDLDAYDVTIYAIKVQRSKVDNVNCIHMAKLVEVMLIRKNDFGLHYRMDETNAGS